MSGRQTGEQRDRSSAGGRPLLSMALLAVLMASLSGGCAWTARGSQAGEAEFREIRTEPEAAISHEELRLRLMRFTDAFYDALGPPMDPILDSPDLNLRRAALEMLYNYSAASIAIATGPFPATNLLDMVVFMALIHGSMEEYWVPRFGGHGKAAVEVVARYERDIWDLAAILLSDQQQEDLLLDQDRHRANGGAQRQGAHVAGPPQGPGRVDGRRHQGFGRQQAHLRAGNGLNQGHG